MRRDSTRIRSEDTAPERHPGVEAKTPPISLVMRKKKQRLEVVRGGSHHFSVSSLVLPTHPTHPLIAWPRGDGAAAGRDDEDGH
eukprot:COSAG02_NODE_50115_length_322_cov_1.174888_1_plen_83_part_01